MSPLDDKYWNLAQAAAWVEYRSKDLVEKFEDPSRSAYIAISMYPSASDYMTKMGDLSELQKALLEGSITAWGRSQISNSKLEEIPSIEWADLKLEPPDATRRHPTEGWIKPWTDIRLESAAIKKRWRSEFETTGRSRFNWKRIREIHDEIKSQNPLYSQNELIIEIRDEYASRFNKAPPSRTSCQSHMKNWS